MHRRVNRLFSPLCMIPMHCKRRWKPEPSTGTHRHVSLVTVALTSLPDVPRHLLITTLSDLVSAVRCVQFHAQLRFSAMSAKARHCTFLLVTISTLRLKIPRQEQHGLAHALEPVVLQLYVGLAVAVHAVH